MIFFFLKKNNFFKTDKLIIDMELLEVNKKVLLLF